MKKTWLNFWLDLGGLVALISLAATGLIMKSGLIMKYGLPPQGGRRRGTGLGPDTLLGMDRHDWGDIHFVVAALLAVFFVAHLALHWKWIWRRIRELGKTSGDTPCPTDRAD